jgi:hypothetical protein
VLGYGRIYLRRTAQQKKLSEVNPLKVNVCINARRSRIFSDWLTCAPVNADLLKF